MDIGGSPHDAKAPCPRRAGGRCPRCSAPGDQDRALPPAGTGSHRVVFGTLEAIQDVLAPHGWPSNTAFMERINFTIRQYVAAVGRRVSTLCKGEDGLRHQLAMYRTR